MNWRFRRRPKSAQQGRSRPDESRLLRPDLLGYLDSSGRGECELVIGFDFGTSASKIVVQAPFQPDQPLFLARRSGRVPNGADWLWPSRIAVDSRGACTLDGDATSRLHDAIKLGLMKLTGESESSGEDVGSAAAAFLGLVLREVRSGVLLGEMEYLRSFATIRWSLNLGIPSGSTVEPVQEQLFQRVAEAGWRLSLAATSFSLDAAGLALQERDIPDPALKQSAPRRRRWGWSHWFGTAVAEQAREAEVEINLFPEVVAGAFGYARSDSRRDGLHLVIDVGAATVDACFFLLPKEDEERWPLLEASVERLGTAELHRRQIAAVREVDAMEAQKLQEAYDPLDAMALGLGLHDSRYASSPEIIKANRDMEVDLRRMIGGLIQTTITERDPNAPAFRTGGQLPILRMGGGSRADFYKRFVRGVGFWLGEALPTGHRGVQELDTPVRAVLDQATEGHGHRLAVAFGLSHPPLDLPRVKRPSDISRIELAVAHGRLQGDFVGKEHV